MTKRKTPLPFSYRGPNLTKAENQALKDAAKKVVRSVARRIKDLKDQKIMVSTIESAFTCYVLLQTLKIECGFTEPRKK